MARQARASTSPNVPMKWSKEFYKYSLEHNFFGQAGLIGEGANSCIRVHKDLKVMAGNKVRMPMSGPLTGVGGGDDFNSADILEAYSMFHFDIEIHERGNTTGVSGPYTQQLMIEDWPREATEKLAQWKGVILEREIVKALSGIYNLSTSVASVNESAPSATRWILGGGKADGTLGVKSGVSDGTKFSTTAVVTTDALLSAETVTDYLMDPTFIEHAATYFMNQEPRPQLLIIEGRPCLLLLMTPTQGLNLRQNATYKARNMYAEVRGSKNPLLSDSLGFWACGQVSVLLKPYGRIESRTGASGTLPTEGFSLNDARTATDDAIANAATVGRALLLGAQAGGIAYGKTDSGQMFKRFKGDLDSGTKRKPFKGVEWIYGIAKTVFQDEADSAQPDFACVAVDTCQV